MPETRRIARRIPPAPHMLSNASSSLRRMFAAVNGRRYVVAGVCLLAVAGGLRFYDLGGNSLWHDEAVAALIARGTLWEVVVNAGTSYSNTSPALYPAMLWAVQKVGSAEFSLRLMPAAASLLTVGALLFWMPRLGVARWAAFTAALLAALSVAAIDHARDAREYSVDALVAALIIAGFLQYHRGGRRALLCAALFAGPLLQYGLAVFGVGALAAAAFAPGAAWRMGACGGRLALAAALVERLKGRVDLILPGGCFAAGCALTWALTARHQYAAGGWGGGGYLADFYYRGSLDGLAIARFAGGRAWDLLSYHMPMAIAALALAAFVGLAALALKRGRLDALAVLFLFAIGAAVCAAAFDLYPFGGSRHNLYLGPIVFLAAGAAFHWAAVEAAAIAGRAWVGTALTGAALGAIAVLGAAAVWQADAYYAKDGSMAQVLAALDARKREGDAVYASRYEVPAVRFYRGDRPDNYFYGKEACWGDSWGEASWAECFPEILEEMFRMSNNSRRIWLIHNSSVSVAKEMAAYTQDIAYWQGLPEAHDIGVEEIVGGGWATLHLITGFDEIRADIREEWLDMRAEFASDAPSAVAEYNLYFKDGALYYAKQPCAPSDIEARFFLHVYPRDAAELPDWRRQYGFDNLDFDFHDYGVRVDDKCMIWRGGLPGYGIERIHAGQFVPPNGARVWEAELAGER